MTKKLTKDKHLTQKMFNSIEMNAYFRGLLWVGVEG